MNISEPMWLTFAKKTSELKKSFHRQIVKICYCCTANYEQIHKKLKYTVHDKMLNCINKEICPLLGFVKKKKTNILQQPKENI